MDETIKLKIKTEGETDSLEWEIDEPQFAPQAQEWYFALAILGLAAVVFSILLKNYLFIVIVALVALIIYSSKGKKPAVLKCRIDGEGLRIGKSFYSYDRFDSFWIFPAHINLESGATSLHDREMAFRHTRHVLPLLIVPFHNNDETTIRKILSEHLPESEEQESLIDLLKKRFF